MVAWTSTHIRLSFEQARTIHRHIDQPWSKTAQKRHLGIILHDIHQTRKKIENGISIHQPQSNACKEAPSSNGVHSKPNMKRRQNHISTTQSPLATCIRDCRLRISVHSNGARETSFDCWQTLRPHNSNTSHQCAGLSNL